jgi:hypothetical protein
MNPFNTINNKLNSLLIDAMSKGGGTIQISTTDARIIIKITDEGVVTMIYERGSIQKVWNHTVTSCTELVSASKEILLFLVSKLKLLINWKLLLKRKPMLIEYIPKLGQNK